MSLYSHAKRNTAKMEINTASPSESKPYPTPALLLMMLDVSPQVSDLIFSPAALPHVEACGKLLPLQAAGLKPLTPDDTGRIANDLIGKNTQASAALREQGSCDFSYSIPGRARFRVNVFMQRGSHAIVMRVIPKSIPSFNDLKLPSELAEVAKLKNGIALVTGPTGSGKSSTLAAVIDLINESQSYHILTIEDQWSSCTGINDPSSTSGNYTVIRQLLLWRCVRHSAKLLR